MPLLILLIGQMRSLPGNISGMIEMITGFITLYGLELLAILALFLFGRFSRNQAMVFVGAVVSLCFMAVQFLWLRFISGIASATSSVFDGRALLELPVIVFLVGLFFYFPLALGRFFGRTQPTTRANHEPE